MFINLFKWTPRIWLCQAAGVAPCKGERRYTQ